MHVVKLCVAEPESTTSNWTPTPYTVPPFGLMIYPWPCLCYAPCPLHFGIVIHATVFQIKPFSVFPIVIDIGISWFIHIFQIKPISVFPKVIYISNALFAPRHPECSFHRQLTSWYWTLDGRRRALKSLQNPPLFFKLPHWPLHGVNNRATTSHVKGTRLINCNLKRYICVFIINII